MNDGTIASDLRGLPLRIMDYAKEHGRVTMGDIIKTTGVNRNTLKEHFRFLIKKNYLVLHGKGRGCWYGLP